MLSVRSRVAGMHVIVDRTCYIFVGTCCCSTVLFYFGASLLPRVIFKTRKHFY